MAKETLHKNEAGTHVFVRNPETGGVWECPVGYLPVARERGWEPCEPVDTSLEGLYDAATAEGPAQTGFDPADHTVDQVNAHLAKHVEASPGEVERVLSLEAAGHNRATVKDPRVATDADSTTPVTGD